MTGSRTEYADERALLQRQTRREWIFAGMGVGYVRTSEPLFQYDTWDATRDWVARLDNTYQISTRAEGAIQSFSGVLEVVGGASLAAAGVAACPGSGVGCVAIAAGASLTAVGYDNAQTGSSILLSGTASTTWGGGLVADSFGISQMSGESIYSLISLSAAIPGSRLATLGMARSFQSKLGIDGAPPSNGELVSGLPQLPT